MKKILIYIEPHPIRNNFEEFYDIGNTMVKIFLRSAARRDYVFRFFSNNIIINRMILETPASALCALRPTNNESEQIQAYDFSWDKTSIDRWRDLAVGQGEVTNTYEIILERIYSEFKFDGVLLWSENGAVRRFSKKAGVKVIHGELAPTRSPFPEAMYFDPLGTNGNASSTRFPLSAVAARDEIRPETWICYESTKTSDESKINLIDAPFTSVKYSDSFDMRDPFVFIPLQLSDDLNVIAHSDFTSMRDFLEKTLPPILQQGYSIVIKGHPLAPSRPYNLRGELDALSYAESLGQRIKILPRNTSSLRTINIICQAEAVCTINSSVGYEATLLGKNVISLGRSCYNIGTTVNPYTINNIRVLTSSEDARIKSTTFLSGHYFIPKKEIIENAALFEVIDFIFDNNIQTMDAHQYWSNWMATFRYGSQLVEEKIPINAFSSRDHKSHIVANSEIFEWLDRRILMDEDKIVIVGRKNHEIVSCFGKLNPNSFMGYIEEVQIDDTKSESVIRIRGWALTQETSSPPLILFFVIGANIPSIHRVIMPRDDVRQRFNHADLLLCGFNFEVKVNKYSNVDAINLLLLASNNDVQIVKLRIGAIHKDRMSVRDRSPSLALIPSSPGQKRSQGRAGAIAIPKNRSA